jgi:amino acid permease
MQGHSIEELPFKAMGGVYGSWFGVILLSLVLVAQFYIVSVFETLFVSLALPILNSPSTRLFGLLVACRLTLK